MKDTTEGPRLTALEGAGETVTTGDELLGEVSSLIDERLPLIGDDDPSKPDLIRAASAAQALSALRRVAPLVALR